MLLIDRKEPYGWGYTPITTEGEATLDTMIDFGILRLRAGEVHREKTEKEVAYLLMDGSAEFKFGDETTKRRADIAVPRVVPLLACACRNSGGDYRQERSGVCSAGHNHPSFSHPSSTVLRTSAVRNGVRGQCRRLHKDRPDDF